MNIDRKDINIYRHDKELFSNFEIILPVAIISGVFFFLVFMIFCDIRFNTDPVVFYTNRIK